MKLTVVILTKNEEDTIKRCINSVSFFDEIILIDDNSTDRTTEIAKKLGAIIYKRDLNGDYAAQRNFGLSKARNDWVLFIDADEIVSPKLEKELKSNKLKERKYSGYYIRRSDRFMGKKLKYGESGNIKLLRLGRKGEGKWQRKVHEYWDIKGGVGQLEGELIHYSHKSLRSFISKVSKYSKLHAEENEKEGKSSSLLKILFLPLGKFIYNYFWKLAILDGVHGFVVSIIMSFHSFVSWSSLWLEKRKTR